MLDSLLISGTSLSSPLKILGSSALPPPQPALKSLPTQQTKRRGSRREFKRGKRNAVRETTAVRKLEPLPAPVVGVDSVIKKSTPKPRLRRKSTSKKKVSRPPPRETALERALRAWDPSRRMECIRSLVTIRYSHYNQKFEARDGVIKYEDVDKEYCISYVFRGDYNRELKIGDVKLEKASEAGKIGADYFLGVKSAIPENVYWLVVEEGKEGVGVEGGKKRHGGGLGQKKGVLMPKVGVGKATMESEEITRKLKGMTGEEIREGGEVIRDLIERRDLEDVLYGGGG
ncbi:hypothetical protein TrCOL_g7135 [Triparma columacea]|uniref:Uncharacterized protein n=1 Tax=Triparma columacea TaxID=722753 RepID=A0A9W7L2A2_9STRA|nr:hypothetical protein TrCOL_g7135 [Triparma columacea]